MTAELTKRSLATGLGAASLGLGGLALFGPRALADTPFTTFAFPATGTPAPRTMPDRLAEIKNVKDFGAAGDGVKDDTAAIQAAVNWTTGPSRGTIYFPYGKYLVTRPITFNYDGDLSICFRGESGGSIIVGNFDGYIFDRRLGMPNNTPGGRLFERLTVINGHNTGGCIRLGSTLGAAIRDCRLSANVCVTTEDAPGVSSQQVYLENCVCTGRGTLAGGHNVIIGGGGAIMGCALFSTETAVRAYGTGLHIAGNRCERNSTGFLLGVDSAGRNAGLSGFALVSGTCEGNWTSIDLAGACSGFVIGAYRIQGHQSYNSGATPGIRATQYGIRIRPDCAKAGLINGVLIGSVHEVAAFALESASVRMDLAIMHVNASAEGGGANWILPGTAQTARFLDCNVFPVWTFSQLPTGTNRYEGDEFDIKDSPVATWGATLTGGGGTNRVRVRYNGTNWTVVGA